jgi:hypothetical protein
MKRGKGQCDVIRISVASEWWRRSRSGSARNLLTSEAFITSLWHADLPFFITLSLYQLCEGEPSDLYYLSQHIKLSQLIPMP